MLGVGSSLQGWQPAGQTLKIRRKDEFLDHVAAAHAGPQPVDAGAATPAVFDLLSEHGLPARIRHIKLSAAGTHPELVFRRISYALV